MNSIPLTPDTSSSAPFCLVCNSTASASSVRVEGSIHTGDYRCAAGHIWTTRWLEVA